MGFRKSRQILREAAGAYTLGRWVAGARSLATTMASVQPISGKDLDVMPEGRHMADFVKIYTSDRLKVAADGEGIQPDIIVHDGYGYELMAIEQNQSDVINHYKFIAAKVFKFTTTSDWLSGALKRP